MKVLAFDPSGSFSEGSGTTGYALLDYNSITRNYTLERVNQIKSTDFTKALDYWMAHTKLINYYKDLYPELVVVAEDFVLYANKALQQTGSQMETSKLIGIIQANCYSKDIDVYLQKAVEVKKRWSDRILCYKNLITNKANHYYFDNVLISEHSRDAIRHGVHFCTKLKEGYIKLNEKVTRL